MTVPVRIDAPAPVFDHSLSRRQIKQREHAVNDSGADDTVVLGTTESDIEPNADFQANAKPDGQGGFCATAATMNVVIVWKVTVHIAAELAPGSCMYGVVLTHEQGHVDINRRFMDRAKRLLQSAMSAVASQSFAGTTPERSYDALKSAARAAIHGATRQLDTELRTLQRAHDTPEEYTKGQKVCGMAAYNQALGG